MPNEFEVVENTFYAKYPSGIYLFYAGVGYHQVLIVKGRCWERQQNCYFPWYFREKRVLVGLSIE